MTTPQDLSSGEGTTNITIQTESSNKCNGRYVGTVIEVGDIKHPRAIRVRVRSVFDEVPDDALPWATPHSTCNVIPRVGDVVTVEFDDGERYYPIWYPDDATAGISDIEKHDNLLKADYPNVAILHQRGDVTVTLNTENSDLAIRLGDMGDILVTQAGVTFSHGFVSAALSHIAVISESLTLGNATTTVVPSASGAGLFQALPFDIFSGLPSRGYIAQTSVVARPTKLIPIPPNGGAVA